MGLDADSIRGITVAALSLEEGMQETLCQTALGAAEKFLSRQYLCRGFCSGGRIVLLLTSDTGFFRHCMLPSTSCAGRCTGRCG